MQKAIQFIGTQRSGSNLLRVMLHQHPEISAPHPPHILQMIMPFMSMYGDLQDKNNFKLLIDDACTLVELNPVSWNIKFDREIVFTKCQNRSLPQVMKAIYEIKAESKHASFWCCKSMSSIHYAKELESSGIHPFYIFIFRDGRDVALSFLNAMVGEKHIYHLAKQWKEEQELSLALCESVGEDRCIKIRYEDFTENAESVLKMICNKIGLEFSSAMLNYSESVESRETAASGKMWANLVKPVMKNNTKKFLSGLSGNEISLYEDIAGDMLDQLGYKREFEKSVPRIFSDLEIKLFTEENLQAKSESKKFADPEDIVRRANQEHFIQELKTRFNNFHSRIA